MPPAEILIAFFLATCVFAYMPGPAMLYAAAQTIARGQRAGWFAALGIHIGGYVHVLAAACGLAVLFQAVPTLYLALKICGAIYLIWLGFRLLLTKKTLPHSEMHIEAKSPIKAFWESAMVEILNPKTAIFYLAFLPQFTDPNASFAIGIQLLVLGIIVNIMFSSADAVCVLLASRVTSLLRKSGSATRIAQRIGGMILIGLGLNILLSKS